MTQSSVRWALAIAAVVAAAGGISMATAAGHPGNTNSPGGYGVSQCGDGKWQTFTTAPGPFKNQGQCVSYFAHQQNGH